LRTSKLLRRLRAGQAARICSLGGFNPVYVKHAATNGFDCIWLDLEHRAMETREVQAMLAFFHLCDIDCMLRPPTLEKSRLYRYLEDGAAGLMIPHVSTVEKARMLVQATKFPPLGDRGLDGSGLDADYYTYGSAGYTEAANRETFLVVQIETLEAIANVEEIAAVAGVDGLFIGPGDLGLRLKHAPAPAMTMEQCIAKVAAAADAHGKAWGMPAANVENLRKLSAQGAKLVSHGSEFAALTEMLAARGREWREIAGE
jgi:4-hydroxy-2-oxoheptanedioate aldolase